MPPPLPDREVRAPASGACGSRTALVYWPAVAAAALLSLFVLTGLLAWLAAHPGSRSSAPPALAFRAVETKPASLREAVRAPLPREEPAALTTPAAPSAPENPAPATEVKEPALVDTPAPPPLAPEPPAQQEAKADETPEVPVPPEPQEPILTPAKQLLAAQAPAPVCAAERYGTRVDFLNNPQVAARQARTQAKLIFLLHVSGNFEDNCFT